MSYIITAEVDTTCEENAIAEKTKVNARILSERKGYITFDVRGDFENQKKLTKDLCSTLIDAGFISFKIGHSY